MVDPGRLRRTGGGRRLTAKERALNDRCGAGIGIRFGSLAGTPPPPAGLAPEDVSDRRHPLKQGEQD